MWQNKNELSSIPIRLWVPERDGLRWYYIQAGKPYRQEMACRMQFYSLIRGSSVSPNRRYLVVALHAETLVIDVVSRKWKNLTHSQRHPDGSYTVDVVYVRSWAPDSRCLLANSERIPPIDLPIFSVSPPRRVRTVIAPGEILEAGWYPDGKHLYYVFASKENERQPPDASAQPHYLLSITGGKPRKLSPQEVNRLRKDWDYLAFRWGANEPNWVAYTLNRRVRTLYNAERTQPIIVERRGGERRVLTIPNTVNTPIHIRDIDADHQHLLVMDNYFNFFVVRIADNRWSKIGHVGSLVPDSQMGDAPETLVAEFVNTGYLFRSRGY